MWAQCNGFFDGGSDCFSSKGFAFVRLELAPGAEVDVYNLHGEASNNPPDIAARASNFAQLRDAILANSAGRALIVAGDTNLHGFNANDEPILQDFLLTTGLADGCRTLACGIETLDRIFLRSSANVALRPALWRFATEFVDASGNNLSDTMAVHVRVDWTFTP